MAKIELEHVGLTFRIRKGGRVGLKEFLVSGLLRKKENPYMEVQALRDVCLSITDGQRVGIIGHNGAGKSTLIRLIAGVYPPSSGVYRVEGKISSLMDIGLGIEPTASGWNNIAYRCYLQGDTPKEVEAKRPDIAAFSELGEFLHMPIRFYSSGMYVRFAFAVATAIEPEILLLDEVFGAGDLSFQEKARKRMHQLVDKARILVFVSHDLEMIGKLCDRVIWMDKGTVLRDGKTREIISQYKEQQLQSPQAA
jgi:ABC-type polysaccharide/polyol phosphate transport system ATPase subunit